MSRRSLALAPMLAALAFAPPALAQSDQSQSITATGVSQAKVVPVNRDSNASIVAAVAAAQKQAVLGALKAAHANALLYAQSAGLTLGSVTGVSDATNNNLYIGPYGTIGNYGRFGPNKYCGTVKRRTTKKVNGKKVSHTRKVYVCTVPEYSSSTLSVTYAAS